MAVAAAHGIVFGLIRIAWIIVASLFLYQIAVETGQFQVMKDSIAALSTRPARFSSSWSRFASARFSKGTGGGGAPVAIAGSFLIGLGFEPFQAATLCLLANTAPVAWGAVGTPIRVLSGVTGFPENVVQRHDRANLAPGVGDPAALAGAQHGRLAADMRCGPPSSSAGSRSQRRSFTGRTIRIPGWSTSSRRWSRS